MKRMNYDGINSRIGAVKYTLRQMGYDENYKKGYEREHILKLMDIIIKSKANHRDRGRMLKYLQHIVHRLPMNTKDNIF